MAGLDLPPGAQGVLPSQLLARAVELGIIDPGDYRPVPLSNIQPASVDLRLGDVAYRIRCSFLPDRESVDAKRKEYTIDELDLTRDGAVLETNRPYLIPLIESLKLPKGIRGKANPKSSTGRLDVFTRVITDHSYRFDEIRDGYEGRLYLEVVPLSFTVKVRQGLALNQLRLSVGDSALSDGDLHVLHEEQALLFRGGRPATGAEFATAGGLFLGLDLRGDGQGRIGYRAREHAPLLEMAKTNWYQSRDFWEPVYKEGDRDRIVLGPEKFYLLLSEQSVRIPPEFAAEMTAFDPTSGELRTHYAGFFDPGFGYDEAANLLGSRAALEVRAHDVPFMIEHGQRVCKLTFERMLERPETLYGDQIGSAYQHQDDTLGKHFRREGSPGESHTAPPSAQPDLFSTPEPEVSAISESA